MGATTPLVSAAIMLWSVLAAAVETSTEHTQAPQVDQAVETAPQEVLKGVLGALGRGMGGPEAPGASSDPWGLYELVERVVAPHLDFRRMARRALGSKRWKNTEPELRQRYVDAFHGKLIRSYARALESAGADGLEGMEVVETKPGHRKNEQHIRVRATRKDGKSVDLQFAVAAKGGKWQVFDIKLEGVSLIKSYRADFRGLIAQHGVEGLVARLEAEALKR